MGPENEACAPMYLPRVIGCVPLQEVRRADHCVRRLKARRVGDVVRFHERFQTASLSPKLKPLVERTSIFLMPSFWFSSAIVIRLRQVPAGSELGFAEPPGFNAGMASPEGNVVDW